MLSRGLQGGSLAAAPTDGVGWPSVDAASVPWPGQVIPPQPPDRPAAAAQEGGCPGTRTMLARAAFSGALLPTALNLGFFSLKSRDVIGTILYSTDSLSVELRDVLLQKRLFAP